MSDKLYTFSDKHSILMISKSENEKRYEKRIQFIMNDINCNRETAERIYRNMEDKTYVIMSSR